MSSNFIETYGKEKVLSKINEGIMQRKNSSKDMQAFDVSMDDNFKDYTLYFNNELAAFRFRDSWLNAGMPVETSGGWSSNLNCYFVTINQNVTKTYHRQFFLK